MKKESVAFINRIKETVLSVEPKAKIILYGSRAKGTARSDSDWDVLILLAYQKITLEIEKKVVDPLYELEFETGEVISPMVYAEQEWNTKYSITPFYANVNKEGIPLGRITSSIFDFDENSVLPLVEPSKRLIRDIESLLGSGKMSHNSRHPSFLLPGRMAALWLRNWKAPSALRASVRFPRLLRHNG
ncbi:nucleotidyltransferase domain-containing protein [Candidatus Gracilibacteria bacterium]|nr:nucleotidyltransferase domain-containing protein [Candidatus Gracilibacteria bacterium]